ncbi:MAG: RHS repeat-associated core domain-containing protein [Candidatus Edwardsbacteria bacterium]
MKQSDEEELCGTPEGQSPYGSIPEGDILNLYGMSTATDVAPGGIDAVSRNVIYYSYPVPPPEQMPPYPGAPRVSVTMQYYHYDGMYAVLESEGSGGYKYIYANGLLLARINVATGEKHYYHHDGLGSVVGMTDVNGSVVQSYVYDEFGNLPNAYGTAPNSYLYTGQEWDVAPCNFYNLRARMYSPNIGRFGSEDPVVGLVSLPQSINRYIYVGNSPVNFIDPTGLQAVCPTQKPEEPEPPVPPEPKPPPGCNGNSKLRQDCLQEASRNLKKCLLIISFTYVGLETAITVACATACWRGGLAAVWQCIHSVSSFTADPLVTIGIASCITAYSQQAKECYERYP